MSDRVVVCHPLAMFVLAVADCADLLPVRGLLLAALLLVVLSCAGAALAQDGGDGADGDEPVDLTGSREAQSVLGDPPDPIAEPVDAPDHSSPLALLASVVAARDNEDIGALARAQSTSVGRDQLNERDAQRARRDFLNRHHAELWTKLAEALDADEVAVTIEELDEPIGDPPVDATARASVEVGGALGTFTVRFLRVDGKWYVRAAP